MSSFENGDKLAAAGDRVALEYGWWAVEWIESEAKESKADPLSRAAFSYALTTLEQRHGKWLSRSQITDRIRIGRAFPVVEYADLVSELHYVFTFSQLRAAYVANDKEATTQLLLWAAENDAEPLEINAKKVGGAVESAEAKAWRNLVMWARKYLDRCEEENRRCKVARAVVEEDEKTS